MLGKLLSDSQRMVENLFEQPAPIFAADSYDDDAMAWDEDAFLGNELPEAARAPAARSGSLSNALAPFTSALTALPDMPRLLHSGLQTGLQTGSNAVWQGFAAMGEGMRRSLNAALPALAEAVAPALPALASLTNALVNTPPPPIATGETGTNRPPNRG